MADLAAEVARTKGEVERIKSALSKLYFRLEELDYGAADPKHALRLELAKNEVSTAADCLACALADLR